MARTVAQAHARLDDFAAEVKALSGDVKGLSVQMDVLIALMDARTPARVTPAQKKTPAKKASAKKVTPAKVTKGAQTRETLSRKDWNRTLTTKARLAGGGAYKAILAQWSDAQAMREAGRTPDEALEALRLF